MGFNLGNVVKYLWRAGLKDQAPTLQDLKKAAWYLNDEIQTLERQQARGVSSTGTFKLIDDPRPLSSGPGVELKQP
jgi:hypothetical protein